MKTVTLFVGDEDGLRDVVEDKRKMRKAAPLDPEYGRQLRARRLELGMTQEELAKAAGVHFVTISRLETGDAPLTPKMKARLGLVINALKG